MKKKLFAIIALLVILTGVVAGTVAYFTGSATAHNVITSGHIDIDLVETMLDEKGEEIAYPKDAITGVVPGNVTSKIVRVHNVGENPAWVRVKVETSITAGEEELSAEVLEFDFDTTKWVKRGDYYYYQEKLDPQDSTDVPLFTQVTMKRDTGNAYQNARIEIDISAEGIQYQNNTDFDTAWPEGIAILPFI